MISHKLNLEFLVVKALYFLGFIKQKNENNFFSIQLLFKITQYIHILKILFYASIMTLFRFESYKILAKFA